MSNSLRGKKISESFPRLVQVINGVFYDGTGQPLLTLNGATAGIGPQGIQGLRGPIGFDGSRGFQGYQGVDGAFAGRGFQGSQGASPVYETVLTFQGVWDASTNTPTLSGATGASGDTYIVGATGIQNLGGGTVSYSVNDLIIYSQSQWVRAGSASFGAQGAQGYDGNEGAQGPQGVEGFQGVQGVPGEYAAIGLQGSQGFEGFQGAQGVEGFQGAQGPEPVFPTVLDLKGIWNAETNDPPINNNPGPGYLTGSTGDTWLVGVTGTQDLGSGSIFFGVNDLVVYVNSVWVNTGNSTVGIQGAQGPQGIQGSEGPQGFQGWQGFDGPQGFQGWQGDLGPTGNQGPQGPQGVQGSQGLRGFQGIQGVQGDQGPQGIQGSQGPQGIQGSQGPQGVQGSEGPQGFQGFQGPQGYQGATGPQPIFPSVLTFKGVWDASANNPTLANGTGSTGDTYIVGVTGSRDLGAGATVTYNVNDLVVYSETQWKKAGSATTGVQGSQGWQGVQGIQGVQGAQGWQGPQGVQGIQGSQGAQGWQGPQGIQGVQGAQGSQGLQGDTGSSGDIGFQGAQGFGFQGSQGSQGIPGPTGQSLSGVFVSAPISGGGSTSTDPVALIYNTDFTLTTVNTPSFLTGISLNLDATTIVTPSIVSYSQIFKSDGFTPFGATTISGSTVGPVSSSNNFTVPSGCRVIYGGTATIPVAGAGQGTPTAVSGAFIFSPSPPSSFPAVGVTNPSTQLTSTTSFSVNISKPKSGLIVSGGQVVRASGNDTSSASATVTFSNVFYYGYLQVGPVSIPIPQATVDLIGATSVAGDPGTLGIQNMAGLTYRFGTKAQAFAVTTANYSTGYRVVFAYPASLGNVSTLTVTGSSINQIGAFTKATTDVPIVTVSGTTVAYRLYVSNADNAWNTTITTT